jgi:hypothetical protein
LRKPKRADSPAIFASSLRSNQQINLAVESPTREASTPADMIAKSSVPECLAIRSHDDAAYDL